LRLSLKLGTTYALATRLYLAQENLDAETRQAIDELIKKAKSYADTLAVPIDQVFPTRLGTPEDRQRIMEAASRCARQIDIGLRSLYGSKSADAFQLGFRGFMASEFVAKLPKEDQLEYFGLCRKLASSIGLPADIVDRLERGLLAQREKNRDIEVIFGFRDEVLFFIEGSVLRHPDISRQRLNTWELGHKLGLAALGHAAGARKEVIERMFDECRILGTALNVEIPTLQDLRGDKIANDANALHFLLVEVGKPIATTLSDRFGSRFSSLFDLAIKSNIAILIYIPGQDADSLGATVIGAIEKAGKKSAVPEALWSPLVAKMRSSASHDEVKAEVRRMKERISQYLQDFGAK
jgi:hypothetical protein